MILSYHRLRTLSKVTDRLAPLLDVIERYQSLQALTLSKFIFIKTKDTNPYNDYVL